jgi:iron-sulfur cluster repair protein YtfE (RIC family)
MTNSSEEKRAIFEELADDLAVHMTIEEELFYPAAFSGEREGLLSEALQEHLVVKRIIVDLTDTPADDQAFDAKVRLMQTHVRHHVQEEEAELFPRMARDLEGDEYEKLSAKIDRLFAREMNEGPSRNLVNEATRSPDLV